VQGFVKHLIPLLLLFLSAAAGQWTLRIGGARAFYTALGHTKEHYANPILYQHILGGILWAMERDTK
jgi:type 1 glutamine amidotransferase